MIVSLRQISATASVASMGDYNVTVDRPVEKGGTGTGPMGGDLFLASIGGCFMSNVLAAIRARNAAVSDVRIEVDGTVSGTPPVFASIVVSITAECADRELLDHLIEIADRGCIMMNTLRGKLPVSIRTGVTA
jgi:putative redox protein